MAYHSVKIKAKVKADYKTSGLSIQKLSDKYQIPAPTVRSWCENIEKGELKPEIQEKTDNKMVDLFSKIGFDDKKVANILKKMADANRVIPIGDGATEIVEDWQARDKAITQRSKLTGSYAAEKKETQHKITIEGLDDILGKVYPE